MGAIWRWHICPSVTHAERRRCWKNNARIGIKNIAGGVAAVMVRKLERAGVVAASLEIVNTKLRWARRLARACNWLLAAPRGLARRECYENGDGIVVLMLCVDCWAPRVYKLVQRKNEGVSSSK